MILKYVPGMWDSKVISETWNLKCTTRNLTPEMWTLKFEPWNMNLEIWTLKCETWNVKPEIWTLKFEPWNLNLEIWTLKFEPWNLNLEMWTLKWETWNLKPEMWNPNCETWNVKPEIWNLKCETWNATLKYACCSDLKVLKNWRNIIEIIIYLNDFSINFLYKIHIFESWSICIRTWLNRLNNMLKCVIIAFSNINRNCHNIKTGVSIFSNFSRLAGKCAAQGGQPFALFGPRK